MFGVGQQVPAMMKFIDYDSKIGHASLHVAECKTPDYNKETEVLIKMEATAINRADLLQTHGKYPPPKGASTIIGIEAVGYLVDPKTDVVTDVKVMCSVPGGGYAEYIRAHKDHIIKFPSGISINEAAAIPDQWIEAYQLTHTVAKLKKGETAMIVSSISGTGTCILQLCNLIGA
jgi:tumor protein p53-inducible protein 3